jgi:hypothetical protein
LSKNYINFDGKKDFLKLAWRNNLRSFTRCLSDTEIYTIYDYERWYYANLGWKIIHFPKHLLLKKHYLKIVSARGVKIIE